MIKFIERSLSAAIRSLAATATGKALASMANWEWFYVENPGRGNSGVKVDDIRKLKSMKFGSYLVLKPKSTDAGVENMLAARTDAGWDLERAYGDTCTSDGRGCMAQAIDKMKRGNLTKNYTMHVVFTKRFALSGEKYRATSEHGAITPVLVVRAKRNRRYKRII